MEELLSFEELSKQFRTEDYRNIKEHQIFHFIRSLSNNDILSYFGAEEGAEPDVLRNIFQNILILDTFINPKDCMRFIVEKEEIIGLVVAVEMDDDVPHINISRIIRSDIKKKGLGFFMTNLAVNLAFEKYGDKYPIQSHILQSNKNSWQSVERVRHHSETKFRITLDVVENAINQDKNMRIYTYHRLDNTPHGD